MHCKLRREHILSFAATAKPITSKPGVFPVATKIKMVADEGSLTMSATNTEHWLKQAVVAETKKPGAVMVAADTLYNICSLLGGEDVELRLDETLLSITSADDSFVVVTSDPEEAPKWPAAASMSECEIDLDALKTSLSDLSLFISKERGRYALNGVFVELTERGAEFCGTDGRRLGFRTVPSKNRLHVSRSFIFPISAILLLEKIEGAGEAVLRIAEDFAELQVGGLLARVAGVCGEFPDCRSVLPTNLSLRAKLSVAELKSAVCKARITAEQETRAVSFLFSDGALELRSTARGVGSARVLCPAGFSGNAPEFMLDSSYVLDTLSVMSSENVVLEFIDGDTGVILHCETAESELYLIMPICK